eukprot:4702829-Prymnesium_polylepis.1
MATAILGEVLPDARPTRLLPSESWVQVGEQAGPSTASIILLLPVAGSRLLPQSFSAIFRRHAVPAASHP